MRKFLISAVLIGTAITTLLVNVADAALSAGVSLPIFATERVPLNDVPVATFIDANSFGKQMLLGSSSRKHSPRVYRSVELRDLDFWFDASCIPNEVSGGGG